MTTTWHRVALFALSLAVSALGGCLPPPPGALFVPTPQFEYSAGYYRTHGGHYYHYDKDRDGWHYGRDHAEGQRYEERHREGERR